MLRKYLSNSLSILLSILLVAQFSGANEFAYAADAAGSQSETLPIEESRSSGDDAVSEMTADNGSSTDAQAIDEHAGNGASDAPLSEDSALPVPGADAPTSPTNANTHIDMSAEDLLSENELDEAYSKLYSRSARDYSSATFADILVYAEQYVGLPYVWGGKDLSRDGGFDCSGFVNWVYNHVAGAGVNSDYTNAQSLYYDHCTPVSEADAQPGDIVFWKGTYGGLNYISHVGIYCGNGICIDAGDPIGYDRVTDIKNTNGQTAERVYGRLVTLADSKVRLSDKTTKVRVADQAYTGTPRTPQATVVAAGSVLTEGRDYSVSYSNNVNVGTATVTIVGMGSYAGSSTSASFEIFNDSLGAGSYTIASASDASMVVDIPGASKDGGAATQLYGANGTYAQVFTFERTDDGFFAIKNDNSGLYLSLYTTWADLHNGSAITQQAYYGGLSQKWCVKSTSNGYEISSAMDCSMVFDIANGSISSGSSVRAYSSNRTAAQRWNLIPTKTKRETIDALAALNAGALADGSYDVQSSISNSFVFDAQGGNTQNGTAVQLYRTNGTDAQAWNIRNVGGGYVAIENVKAGKVLDVPSANAYAGQKLQLWDSNGSWAQKWIPVVSSGKIKFVSALDAALVIDVPNGDATNGNVLQLWSDNGSNAQAWTLGKHMTVRERIDALAAANKDALPAGTYMVQSAVSGSMVFDARGGGTSNGTRLQVYSSNSTDAQRWIVSCDESGYLTIRCATCDKVLDVSNGSAFDGAAVQLWESNDTWAQKWVAVQDGNGIKIVSALDDSFAIDLPSASASNGNGLQLWSSNGTGAQRWLPVQSKTMRDRLNDLASSNASSVDEGSYVVRSAVGASAVFDAAGGSSANGTALQVYEANGTGAQTWKVVSAGDGYVSILNAVSGLAVDVPNADAYEGQKLQLWAPNGTWAQKWIVVKDGAKVKFVSALNDSLVIDLPSASIANGNVLQLWTDNGTNAQRWVRSDLSANITYVTCHAMLPDFARSNYEYVKNYGSYTYEMVLDALNPESYEIGTDQYFMFADLRGYTGQLSADQIDRMIDNVERGRNGVFHGQGQAILDAARKANINEMYFFAHMMIETGWGTSNMAKGKTYQQAGWAYLSTGESRWCEAGTYRNFIGWGAYDGDPSAAFDYARYYGWNSIDAALDGAAEKLAKFYIYAGQETLYEMRWNSDAAAQGPTHQYCTDLNWTKNIAKTMAYNWRFAGVVPNATYRVPSYS